MKKIPMAMLVIALIAITVMERKKAKAVQERARRAMYPGDTQEMAEILTELKSHKDPESQTLASQLEERLKIRGHRPVTRKAKAKEEGNRSPEYCESCQSALPPVGMFCENCGAPRSTTTNPLGPRDLGSIFKETFRIYWAGFHGIVIIVALVQVPLSLLGVWSDSAMENVITDKFPNFNPEDPSIDIPMVLEAVLSFLLIVGIILIATWLTSIIMTGALTHAVSGQLLGNPVEVGQAYSFAFSRFGAMLGASFLAGLAAILMAITIIGIPFAIFFAVRWFFVMQTASLERKGPLAALARSSELVRNNWWRTFGILLLMGILLGIANGIASAVLGLIPYLGPIAVGVLFAPVWIIVQILLYQDLRTRRDEGYGPAVLASELQGVRDQV